ncbi:hypothetical protein SAMN05216464_11856 [Mucilaginibacter pineti]|uniref:Uncharacterized protein n=1 Tax=Mucilaginibacter pineti TaxID=1391627 RepID=A0A1G7L6Y5_9SPHI|nr:hypothetical protein [Mucilaginibacter pineti]SDF45084.1 hypothetical protein SAMN05216464_11856 [Mucilaginibacter pineti]
MNKLRQVPIFTIEGTSFLVDVHKQVLRQTNDQDNEISFINNMQDHGTFYRLLYDPDEKCSAEDLIDQSRVKVIDIPPLTELDPEGMSVRYGIPENRLKGKTDFEVIVDQDWLKERQNGVLPRINIAGEEFTIDLRLQELRHTKYFFPVISLKSFELTTDGEYYQAFYHPAMKQVVSIDPKLTEFPESIIQIRLPNELGLDPVATARRYGVDENDLLRRYPPKKDLQAAVIPLADTGLPALIRQNREQLQKEHAEIARRIRPPHWPHF